MVSAVLDSSVDAPLLTVTLSGNARDWVTARSASDEASSTKRPHSELIDRFDLECRAMRRGGYNPAVAELIRLCLEIGRRGHTIFLEGAAAGSTLFSIVGLTPLNPLEHGLFTERFVDTGMARDWPLDETSDSPFEFMVAQVSMSRTDLVTLLRQRGYSLGVESDSIPGYPSRTVTAEMREHGAPGPRIQLAVDTSTLAVLSNRAGKIDSGQLLGDVQTWHLLAAGATEGIDSLESLTAQSALRSRKPRSLLALADVLAVSRPHGLGSPECPVIYQEDLMEFLGDRLGIGLRTAWNLIRVLSASHSHRQTQAREWFSGVIPPEPLSAHARDRLWEQLSEQCPGAACKAHYLVTAYHCLRAAFLKAHYPEDFKGVHAAVSHRSALSIYRGDR